MRIFSGGDARNIRNPARMNMLPINHNKQIRCTYHYFQTDAHNIKMWRRLFSEYLVCLGACAAPLLTFSGYDSLNKDGAILKPWCGSIFFFCIPFDDDLRVNVRCTDDGDPNRRRPRCDELDNLLKHTETLPQQHAG